MKAASTVYKNESGQTSKLIAGSPDSTAQVVREGRSRAGKLLTQVVDAPLNEKSDEVLITMFQQGERGVFRVLVERYQARIKNLIYSIFHEPDVIDDLAQEVFIKACEALPQFRFQSSFYTWLYRIAVNRSRDELRKRKLRRLFSLQTLVDSADREVTAKLTVQPKESEVQEIVASALKSLPERYRMVIILKDIDGLSYEEISEVLQCELGTVKSRLFRARAMLRSVLKPLLEEHS
ncbi:MAG: sigma-70 family RNA polymerase sigma factor [Ignavibacteria bacterium]|nr:sigma-70 family RNA polymerase sigma factor [Ignavibacteria bacterium]